MIFAGLISFSAAPDLFNILCKGAIWILGASHFNKPTQYDVVNWRVILVNGRKIFGTTPVALMVNWRTSTTVLGISCCGRNYKFKLIERVSSPSAASIGAARENQDAYGKCSRSRLPLNCRRTFHLVISSFFIVYWTGNLFSELTISTISESSKMFLTWWSCGKMGHPLWSRPLRTTRKKSRRTDLGLIFNTTGGDIDFDLAPITVFLECQCSLTIKCFLFPIWLDESSRQ